MIPGEHTGEWHLPNGKKYPGQLIIDSKKETIQLNIFGTEFIEGEIIKIPDTYPQHFHTIILGECDIEMTLYNCHWAGCEEVAKNLYRIEYRIEYVFTGIHFPDPSMLIRGGTFIFPNLSTWYDGQLFLDKLEGRKGLYIDGKHVVQDVTGTDEIKINSELTLFLYDEVRKHIHKMSISYKVVYQKYLRLQYLKDVPFKTLLKDAITLLKLMAFCFGKPLNLFITSVHVDKKYLEADPLDSLNKSQYRLIHVNNYTLKGREKISNNSSHSRHMLLSRWTCTQEEMKQIIVKWFNNQSLHNIYEFYLDSNNWLQGTKARLSNIMFNNRFLNLIQGLEDYYREHFEVTRTASDRQQFDKNKVAILKTITDASLKKWLNNTFKFSKYPKLEEKLSTILTDLSGELSILFAGIPLTEFPKSATLFRNNLSHGMSKEINQGVSLHMIYYIAQVLLGTCILRTLEVKDIKKRIAYYSKFEDAAHQIHFMQNHPS